MPILLEHDLVHIWRVGCDIGRSLERIRWLVVAVALQTRIEGRCRAHLLLQVLNIHAHHLEFWVSVKSWLVVALVEGRIDVIRQRCWLLYCVDNLWQMQNRVLWAHAHDIRLWRPELVKLYINRRNFRAVHFQVETFIQPDHRSNRR